MTNAQFATFVKATGYVTDAERDGVSAVFHLAVAPPRPTSSKARPACRGGWPCAVRTGAIRPARDRASATCRTTRSSTSRGATPRPTAAGPASDCRPRPSGSTPPAAASTARGTPGATSSPTMAAGAATSGRASSRRRNTLDDGYLTTAPATAFQPNGYGLHNTVGNVWEWCHDAFRATEYADRAGEDPVVDPVSAEPATRTTRSPRVMRGGSYLCHDSYCNRYRVAARSSNTAESSSATSASAAPTTPTAAALRGAAVAPATSPRAPRTARR